MDDKELAAVGIWPRVGHGQCAAIVLARYRFVIEAIPWPAGAGAGWIARLGHKVRDDAVKSHAIVETLTRQEDEIVDRHRRVADEQVGLHRTQARVDRSRVFLGAVDLHRRWRGELLGRSGHWCSLGCRRGRG